MNSTNLGNDLAALFDDIKKLVAGRMSDGTDAPGARPVDAAKLELAVLQQLSARPKDARKVCADLAVASAGAIQVSLDEAYPLLDDLVGRKLVAVKLVDEVKQFELTKAGAKHLADAAKLNKSDAEPKSKREGESLLAAKSQLAKSSLRFGQAVAAVSSANDAKAAIEASKLIDQATKELFALAASAK
jgi:DNA-binding PadR family transcriptional regulator